MKVFVCTSFKGHHPVGVAAVIVAGDNAEAAHLLTSQIRWESLPDQPDVEPSQMIEVDLIAPKAYIIKDGDY